MKRIRSSSRKNEEAKRVLVISPHPDDESVGCGGSIRAHIARGASVRVIFLTSGEQGGHGRTPEQTARIREGEARAAARILGVEAVEFWRGPDGAFCATAAAVKRLREALCRWPPNVVYVPHDREMHPDHRAACRLVRHALARDSARSHPTTVLQYEVWTPLQRMDHIVDISPHVAVKRAAIRAHKSQCAVMNFDAALLALNRYRGEMHSWPGGDYAEVFTIWRPA